LSSSVAVVRSTDVVWEFANEFRLLPKHLHEP
jgi:hypothetical protein